jgi:hypothetical protein
MGNLVHNIGALVVAAASIMPQSSGAAVINGNAIDRVAHNRALSCVLHQIAGAISGAPTGASIVTKLQHSPDGTTWTDFTLIDGVTVATTAALTAANTENSLSINLGSAARYIRPVTTITFTGGTSPAALVAVDLVLGGEDHLAAV